MTDFSITVSNTLSVIGPSPSNKWGAFLWGENWGESGDGYFTIGKNLTESISLASTVTPVAEFVKSLSNTFAVSSSLNFGARTLTDEAGYAYVFPNIVTDVDSRYTPTWTEAAEPSSSFSESSEPSTTWSDA